MEKHERACHPFSFYNRHLLPTSSFFTIPCSNLDETREIRTLSVQLLFLFDRNPFFIEKNIYRLENCFYNIEFINEIIYLFENRFFIFFFFFSFFIRRGENINPLQ